MARAKTEKPIFKGLVICVAGDLGRDWSDEAILRWVKLRDGTVVQEMNDSVTHLLCHMDDFKRKCSKGNIMSLASSGILRSHGPNFG